MSAIQQILDGAAEDWLKALPEYQARGIAVLMLNSTSEEAAILWLDGAGSSDTAPFGGVKTATAVLYRNILVETRKLFCNDPSYEKERQQMLQLKDSGKLAIVAAISVAIGPHLGTAAVFIAPVVAIVLSVIVRASASTACETLTEMIERQAEK